jgi:hypothetical protein
VGAVCGGGPDEFGRLEVCGEPATLIAPYRHTFPRQRLCDRHARLWQGGREPRIARSLYAPESEWDYSPIEEPNPSR